MLARNLAPMVLESLSDTPVVFLAGPRQVGKSTLAQALARHDFPADYVTLDDLATLSAARSDPTGFVAGLRGPTVLDEVQRAGDLLLAIKADVDRHRRPGRFLLTGSANVLALPRVADALVGRMAIHALMPFSQGELAGVRDDFITTAFADDAPSAPNAAMADRLDLAQRVVMGGFPDVQSRPRFDRRSEWFGAYLTTLLQRNVRDILAVSDVTQVSRLLTLVAARLGGTASVSDMARTLSIPHSTVSRHLGLLEALFLVHRLPAWSGNQSTRVAKAPKLHLVDSGLAAHLLGHSAESLVASPDRLGPLFETFVVGELIKQARWSRTRVQALHYRTYDGREVDVVLEATGGRCVGVEVKLSATISPRDLGGLRTLADDAGPKFHRGIILYTGNTVVPFAENLHAVPISALWTATTS